MSRVSLWDAGERSRSNFVIYKTRGLRNNRTVKLYWGLVTSDTQEITNLTAIESDTVGKEGVSDL